MVRESPAGDLRAPVASDGDGAADDLHAATGNCPKCGIL